jgi:hypothetical protein
LAVITHGEEAILAEGVGRGQGGSGGSLWSVTHLKEGSLAGSVGQHRHLHFSAV